MLNRKMNIGKRIFLILSAVGALSFFVFCIVSFMEMYDLRSKVTRSGKLMGESAAEFTEEFAVKQAKDELLAIAQERAERIEHEIDDNQNDAKYLAYVMTRILENPDEYLPKTLPNAFGAEIPNEKAFIYYSPKLREKGISPELEKEIGIVANISDSVEVMAHFYAGYSASCIIGMESGYMIFADVLPDGSSEKFPDSFFATFDPRERPWYKAAANAGKSVMSDIYVDGDGILSVNCAAPFYKDGHFAGVATIGSSWDSLYAQVMAANPVEYNSDIYFAINTKGTVMMSSKHEGVLSVSAKHYDKSDVADKNTDLRQCSEQSLAKSAADMAAGKTGVALVTVDGTDYYMAYAPMPSINWSFGTLIARDKVVAPASFAKTTILTQANNLSSSLNGFFLKNILHTILFLLLFTAIIFIVSKKFADRFVRPILALTNGVKRIAMGDLDKKLDIKTGDELENLADSVNSMTDDLKTYMDNLAKVTAEKERISTELNVANAIQKGMLPSIFPAFSNKKEFDLYATMNPAKQVGGDFYDFYMIDDSHLALTVADVSGKGIPAALFMVVSKTVIKNFATLAVSDYANGGEPDLASVVERANRQLCENNNEMMFVTVFFGVINMNTGDFVYVNGGHNPPLIGRNGNFKYLINKKKFPMLGVAVNAKYEAQRLTLVEGDTLFLYTDGVTEAMNEDGQMYSEERLNTTLDRIGTRMSPKDMLSEIRKDIADHVADAEQSDDITMLGFVFHGDK